MFEKLLHFEWFDEAREIATDYHVCPPAQMKSLGSKVERSASKTKQEEWTRIRWT